MQYAGQYGLVALVVLDSQGALQVSPPSLPGASCEARLTYMTVFIKKRAPGSYCGFRPVLLHCTSGQLTN